MGSPKLDPDGLTVLERRFVDELLKDPTNLTDALRRAGSKAKRMDAAAWDMAHRPKVKAAIEKARAERAKRVQVEVDDVLRELMRLGFANMLDYISVQQDGTAYVNLSKLNRDQAAAIQEVTITQVGEIPTGDGGDTIVPVHKIRFKLADKKGALELIGKHLGMWKGDDESKEVKVRVDVFDGRLEARANCEPE